MECLELAQGDRILSIGTLSRRFLIKMEIGSIHVGLKPILFLKHKVIQVSGVVLDS